MSGRNSGGAASAGPAQRQPCHATPPAILRAAEAIDPPWQHRDGSDVAKRGLEFTVPPVDVLADFHAASTERSANDRDGVANSCAAIGESGAAAEKQRAGDDASQLGTPCTGRRLPPMNERSSSFRVTLPNGHTG